MFGKSSNLRRAALCAVAWLCVFSGAAPAAFAQTLDYERERGRSMLQSIKDDIKKNYYDSTFRGIDLDARFSVADERIKKASSEGQILAIIAQVLVDFDDSHLYFSPPEKASRTSYGWSMQMVGDKCYIVAVQPKSDAEAKGLRPGDEVYSLDGYEPTRENLWKMRYFYYQLRPRPAVQLVVIKPDGQRRELEVKSKVTQGRRIRGNIPGVDYGDFEREAEEEAHLSRQRFYDDIPGLLIWKMPQFDLSEGEVDGIMDKARKRKALILDLRGNGGGYIKTLARLIGNLIDHDVKIGDRKGRKELKPEIAKTRGGANVFPGQLVVLVDNDSGSAAELLARVVQLEKRGAILGDRSSGKVMESLLYPHQVGVDIMTFYGASVTIADVIMSDGKSLEKTGVTPDELQLPTAADMSAGRDPVLARAAARLGFKLDAEKAGALFPIEWRGEK
jgi:carboxyl-terminal processing protease